MWDGVKGRCCSVCQVVSDFASPWTAARQASLSFIISLSLLKLMSIESVVSTNHLILCRHLLLSSVFPSIRVFSSESAFHIRWPQCSSFHISLSNEYSGLISFRIDGLILLSKGLSRVFSAPFKSWGTCYGWEMQTWISTHYWQCWCLTLGTPSFDFPLCLWYNLESF